MEEGLFQWFEFMVQLPWSNFLNFSFKSLAPLTRCTPNVNQEEWPCTKKWMCWFFSIACSKRVVLKKKNLSLSILLSSLGLHLSSLLVKCGEDVACNSSYNNFYKKRKGKKEWFNLYMWYVIYMWYVPCVVTTLNKIFSVWLYLMLLPPYLAQH